jgi:hypothetical protein
MVGRPRGWPTMPGMLESDAVVVSDMGAINRWPKRPGIPLHVSNSGRRVAPVPPHLVRRLRSSEGEPAWNDRHGRIAVGGPVDQVRPLSTCAVKRRRFSSGCKPRPAPAPAGSNRSRHGGDEVSEAFG